MATANTNREEEFRPESARWFVLQALDVVLGHAIAEARFEVNDLQALRMILGDVASDDPELQAGYELGEHNLEAIATIFGRRFELELRPVLLVPWHSTRDAPYLNHSGFELSLMLEGRKPFAKFSDLSSSEWLDDVVSPFERFVKEGRILKRVVRRSSDDTNAETDGSAHRTICEVYFALPGQEWRIDAYLLLVEVGVQSGWNDALERFEGRLLGYEDWQNDWHIKRTRLAHRGWHSSRCQAEP